MNQLRMQMRVDKRDDGTWRLVTTSPDGERYYAITNPDSLHETLRKHREARRWWWSHPRKAAHAAWEALLVSAYNTILHADGLCDCDNGPFIPGPVEKGDDDG